MSIFSLAKGEKEHEVFEMRMWKGSLNRYTTTNKRGIHMDSTWINAPAKINLGLDVIRRRDDGYHEVKMIMQSIRLFDRLTLKDKNARHQSDHKSPFSSRQRRQPCLQKRKNAYGRI